MTKMPQVLNTNLAELVIDFLSSGTSVRLRIKGQSMKPFIHEADVVRVEPVTFEKTKIGDVIVFRANPEDRSLTLHRVIKKKPTYVVTKGDKSQFGDAPVYPENIFGRVSSIERNSRLIDLHTPWRQWSKVFRARYLFLLAWLKDMAAFLRLSVTKMTKQRRP